MKKIFKILTVSFLATFMLASCASSATSSKAKLTKTESRAFWRIDGTDKNGNPSTVYIQGTFHLGDERIYPLSEEVQNAFANADRLVGEMSTESYAELAQVSQVLAAPNKDGKIVTDYLTEEENAFMQMVFGENLPLAATMEPWQSNNALNLFLYMNSELTSEYGLDNAFIAYASQTGRSWEGLDDIQVQIDVLTFGEYEEQIKILKDTIKALTDEEENKKLVEMTTNLYEYYVADDMKEMSKLLLGDELSTGENAELYKEYNEMVYSRRNKDWAEDITNYLAQGGTTFIFAGTAHWIGQDTVFQYLKKMGTIK